MKGLVDRKATARKKLIQFVPMKAGHRNVTYVVAMTICATRAQSLVSAPS